LYGGMGWLIC